MFLSYDLLTDIFLEHFQPVQHNYLVCSLLFCNKKREKKSLCTSMHIYNALLHALIMQSQCLLFLQSRVLLMIEQENAAFERKQNI